MITDDMDAVVHVYIYAVISTLYTHAYTQTLNIMYFVHANIDDDMLIHIQRHVRMYVGSWGEYLVTPIRKWLRYIRVCEQAGKRREINFWLPSPMHQFKERRADPTNR